MNTAQKKSSHVDRADRKIIDNFTRYLSKQLTLDFKLDSFPEDNQKVPSDARIDALYLAENCKICIEHTSIDLVASGSKNKRELDPAFLALSEELVSIKSPNNKGLVIQIPLENAKDRSKLKRITPVLLDEVKMYQESLDDEEWCFNPRLPDKITIEGLDFYLKPDITRKGKVELNGWLSSEHNFLDTPEIEKRLNMNLPSKILKLDCFQKYLGEETYKIIIVESIEVAAQSFHSRCGAFARVIEPMTTKPDEVWGIKGNSNPTLVWYNKLDTGRKDCVYCDDPNSRFYNIIEELRLNSWRKERLRYLKSDSRYL